MKLKREKLKRERENRKHQDVLYVLSFNHIRKKFIEISVQMHSKVTPVYNMCWLTADCVYTHR